MPSEPPSQMIRVPTPLVDAVRELSRLHRAGRTKAVLEGVQRLVTAIDSETDVDIASVSEAISRLSERLDRLEAQQTDSITDIDIASVTQSISNLNARLEKIETDIESIALTTTDLNIRVCDLEGVGDVGYAVTPLSRLISRDISRDSEVTAGEQDLNDISSDIEQKAEPADSADISSDSKATLEVESPSQTQAPLTQSALATRLGISDKAIQKHRQKGKESFAEWSRARDPENVAWTWEGSGGRGQPLRFMPLTSSD